jgi:hypothetical protein
MQQGDLRTGSWIPIHQSLQLGTRIFRHWLPDHLPAISNSSQYAIVREDPKETLQQAHIARMTPKRSAASAGKTFVRSAANPFPVA